MSQDKISKYEANALPSSSPTRWHEACKHVQINKCSERGKVLNSHVVLSVHRRPAFNFQMKTLKEKVDYLNGVIVVHGELK